MICAKKYFVFNWLQIVTSLINDLGTINNQLKLLNKFK